MQKGFGIASLVFAIVSVVSTYGLNFAAIWIGMICATVAALNGDRMYTIASVAIALGGLLLLSPVTMTVVVVNAKGGHYDVMTFAFLPFVFPIAAVIWDHMRRAAPASAE